MREGWSYKKLGEVCEVLNGFAFKSEKYQDQGFRILRITNVQKGTVVDDDPKYYPFSEFESPKMKQYVLRENDLLVSLTGNVGRVGILDITLLPAALNQRVACLRLKEDSLSLKFLFHILNSDSFEQDCILSATGIAQKNMSTEWLKQYVLPIPPLTTQQQIVSELDLLSHILDQKRLQLKEYDALAESIFYDMFGDPVENPKGWEVKKLEEIVSSDCSISYGIVQPGDGVEEGVPVVRPVDLIDTYVYRTGLKQTTKEISDSYKRSILKGGEILMCVRGTTGLASLASQELAGCNVTRGIVPLSFDSEASTLFVFRAFKCKSLLNEIADKTNGIALKQINMKDLRQIELIFPPLTLQRSFAAKIESIEHQKQLLRASIKETEMLFQSRMDYWFNS